MIAPLVFRHASQASQCLTLKHTKSISLTDLISHGLFPKIFAQPPGETSHDYTLCFSTAAAAAPLSASHPRRPRLRRRCIEAAQKGHARRGRAADLCGGQGGRGRAKPAVAPEGFSSRFGRGSDEVTEGVRTLAGDFRAVL